MGRKKGIIPALTGKERTKMCRERKKLLINQNLRVNERFAQRNSPVLTTPSHETPEQPTMKSQLQIWANEYRVSKLAINGLLSIMRSNGISSLPKDFRTLQGTPKTVEILNRAGGQLWYYGLENCLKNIFPRLPRDLAISLNFNIDGLPLFHSSKKTFWPVLASIAGMLAQMNPNHMNMFVLCYVIISQSYPK